MDVNYVRFRSPFGSWMRRECHCKGRITEARFKLYSKGTEMLCITRITTTTGQYLFPGVTVRVLWVAYVITQTLHTDLKVIKMPQLKFCYIRKELHSCKAYMILKMVLDKMFYSNQMVDEKKFQKVLCNETDWVSFECSAFLDGLWVFALTWLGTLLGKVCEFWLVVCEELRTLWHLWRYK